MRILLLEDEPDLGTAIKWALKQEKYTVDWVQDGSEAWDYLQNNLVQYEVAIFDWLVPRITGVELCKRLRQHKNFLPILMLTARDRLQDKIAGLDAGADDYLIKPFEMEELIARLRSLQRRSPIWQIQQVQISNLFLNQNDRTVHQQQTDGSLLPIVLTNKEFQLLEYFMTHPQQIVTKDQLLSQLWDMETEVSSNVVAAQMRLLRRKLAEIGCSDLIETLPSMGYRINTKYAK